MKPVDRLTCEEAFRRLYDYLDGVLTDGEVALVDAHLEACELCAAEFRFERGVIDGIRAKVERPEVPDELRARLESMLRDADGAPQPEQD